MKEFIVKSDGKQFKVKATDYESAIKVVSLVKDSKVDEFLSAISAKLGKYLARVSSNSSSATFTTLGSQFPFIKQMADKYGVKVTFGPEDTGRFTLRLTDTTRDEATQLDVIQALVTDEQAAIAAYTNAIANLDGKVDPQYIEVLRNILKEENKHVENLQAIITGNVTAKNVEDANTSNAIAYGSYYIVNENGGWVVYDHDRQTAFAKYDSLQKAKLAINTGDIEEDYEATLMRHGKL